LFVSAVRFSAGRSVSDFDDLGSHWRRSANPPDRFKFAGFKGARSSFDVIMSGQRPIMVGSHGAVVIVSRDRSRHRRLIFV